MLCGNMCLSARETKEDARQGKCLRNRHYVHASSVCIRAAEGVGPYDSRFDIHVKACLLPEGRRQPKEEGLTWLFIYAMMKTLNIA